MTKSTGQNFLERIRNTMEKLKEFTNTRRGALNKGGYRQKSHNRALVYQHAFIGDY